MDSRCFPPNVLPGPTFPALPNIARQLHIEAHTPSHPVDEMLSLHEIVAHGELLRAAGVSHETKELEMRLAVGLLAAVMFVVVLMVVGGTLGPTQKEDRNVPGATTGKGQSKLFE